jgi:IclR family acetate operon transcriptional repressor
MSQKPYAGTQSVLRAVSLLKAFTDAQPELGLMELAKAAGLNKTMVYRLLTALESERLVARDPGTDGYRLGPEMIALGGRAVRANRVRQVGRPELERLARETGEAATLEVLVGDEVLVLDEIGERVCQESHRFTPGPRLCVRPKTGAAGPAIWLPAPMS